MTLSRRFLRTAAVAAISIAAAFPAMAETVIIHAGKVLDVPGNAVRTCVPQRLRLAGEGEAVRLFMRVTKPMRRVKLVVTSGGETVLTKPLLVAKPSEMIAADLPADKVAGLKADITVAIAEGV